MPVEPDELVRDVVQYEDVYRLCSIRGPEGINIGLAEPLKGLQQPATA